MSMALDDLIRELTPKPPTIHALYRNLPLKSLPFAITLQGSQSIGGCLCGARFITDDIDSAYDQHLHPEVVAQ